MKLFDGLFDMLANKSDEDASNLIEGLAKEMKELKEKMAQMPEVKNGQAFGAKPQGAPKADTGRAQNIVSPNYRPADSGEEYGPAGRSWGEKMPKEPNQFNSRKPFDKYFREIFLEQFPEYEITEEKNVYSNPSIVFTFWKDGRRALVVEVISERTDVHKRRNECRRTGTPYLRYYHDHDGWWNTRSYVIERTKNALSV